MTTVLLLLLQLPVLLWCLWRDITNWWHWFSCWLQWCVWLFIDDADWWFIIAVLIPYSVWKLPLLLLMLKGWTDPIPAITPNYGSVPFWRYSVICYCCWYSPFGIIVGDQLLLWLTCCPHCLVFIRYYLVVWYYCWCVWYIDHWWLTFGEAIRPVCIDIILLFYSSVITVLMKKTPIVIVIPSLHSIDQFWWYSDYYYLVTQEDIFLPLFQLPDDLVIRWLKRQWNYLDGPMTLLTFPDLPYSIISGGRYHYWLSDRTFGIGHYSNCIAIPATLPSNYTYSVLLTDPDWLLRFTARRLHYLIDRPNSIILKRPKWRRKLIPCDDYYWFGNSPISDEWHYYCYSAARYSTRRCPLLFLLTDPITQHAFARLHTHTPKQQPGDLPHRPVFLFCLLLFIDDVVGDSALLLFGDYCCSVDDDDYPSGKVFWPIDTIILQRIFVVVHYC